MGSQNYESNSTTVEERSKGKCNSSAKAESKRAGSKMASSKSNKRKFEGYGVYTNLDTRVALEKVSEVNLKM